MAMNTIVVSINGPYECRGTIELRDAEGKLITTKNEAWLCRCGQSRSKPYCDGSHEKANFQNDTFTTSTDAPLQDTSAALQVKLRRDGPLKLDGPCELRAPNGTVLFRGSETALCRCGSSAKKPFCDGTHRQLAFSAP